MTDISSFILARLDEGDAPQIERSVAEAIRKTVEFHRQFPTLVSGPLEISLVDDYDVFNLSYRATMEAQWMTEQEYIKKFGVDPPTSKIVRAFAQIWKDHEDFKEEWIDA